MPRVNSYFPPVFLSRILGLLILDVKLILGWAVCRRELITTVSLSTELRSEVLLPCSFKSDLVNSNKTEDTCVVWTHLNSTLTDIVEISLDGEAKFWNNRHGRIKTIPKSADSEFFYFSIRIHNVQQSDLGVYHCQLFRETNCSLAYKTFELHKDSTVVSVDSLTWLMATGAAGGAVMLLVLLVVACKFFKCLEKRSCEPVYANTRNKNQGAKFGKEGRILQDNTIYSLNSKF